MSVLGKTWWSGVSVLRAFKVSPSEDSVMSVDDRNEKVSHLAYRKWQEAGEPSGRDMEFWLAAENELYGDLGKPVLYE